MLVYTCPKCGGDLQFSDIATYPPIHVTECPSCGWREEKKDKTERIPYKTSDVASQPSCELLDIATYYKITETGQLCIVKDVYTKDEVISILEEVQREISKLEPPKSYQDEYTNAYLGAVAMKEKDKCIIQSKISELKRNNS